VHDEVDPLLPEKIRHGGAVAKVAEVKGNLRRDGGTVAVGKIVEDDRPVPRRGELPHAVASDVTGSSDDQNVHGPEGKRPRGPSSSGPPPGTSANGGQKHRIPTGVVFADAPLPETWQARGTFTPADDSGRSKRDDAALPHAGGGGGDCVPTGPRPGAGPAIVLGVIERFAEPAMREKVRNADDSAGSSTIWPSTRS
jgi:hypothetical protein